eukprot:scaffold13358_cov198-Alexandrium_tamarense.AAC.27
MATSSVELAKSGLFRLATLYQFFLLHNPHLSTVSVNGVELDDRYWRDTMNTEFNFAATFPFTPREVESYTNVHSHTLVHQDNGMATFYKSLPGVIKETDAEATEVNTMGIILSLWRFFAAMFFL